MKIALKKISLAIAGAGMLAIYGCGGGGGTTASTSPTLVSGVASKGPLNGSTVCAYAIVANIKSSALGPCATNIVNGNYSIDIGTYTGSVLFEATGGTYTDEATGATVALAAPLRSMLSNATGNASSVAVTALTELAYQDANSVVAGLTTDRIEAAIASVQTHFGVADIVNTMPVDALNVPADATAAQKKYALALATVSQYQNNQPAGTSLPNALQTIQACIANPTTSCGTGATSVSTNLTAAMSTFQAAHTTFSGLSMPADGFGATPTPTPTPTPVAPGTQMGGAQQGSPLTLTTSTIVAGNIKTSLLDGTGTAAGFSGSLYGITSDGSNLYVADSTNHRIRKIVIATGVVTTLAGPDSAACMATRYGTCPFGNADGTGTAALFFTPAGVTTDGIHLYVADMGNYKIRKIVIATGVVTTLAGSGGSGLVNATGTAASFVRPRGITTDGTSLYVTEEFSGAIRKIVIETGVVTTLAGSTGGFTGHIDATGTAARFTSPWDITTDGTNLYVTEASSRLIRKIVIATQVVTTLAGNTDNIGMADGTGTAARFKEPRGITTDGTNLYVADYYPGVSKMRKIVIATGVVTTLNSTGEGTDAPTWFNGTNAVTTDGSSLYITDYYYIRKVR